MQTRVCVAYHYERRKTARKEEGRASKNTEGRVNFRLVREHGYNNT